MKRAGLLITLQEDLVLSETAATAGGHRTTDFIPGATLLGASAATLYNALTPEEAFLVYHSGRVRFGNGLPLSETGELGLPLPLSWHGEKQGSLLDPTGRFFLTDALHVQAGENRQQVRQGYVTPAGEWLRPARTLVMKTAINPDTGRANEGQLFGYQTLRAGQRFLATLEADAETPEALFQRVLASLADRSLRLGRSRSAQFGQVTCEAMDIPVPPPAQPEEGQRLTLWLLSDLAVNTPHGMPTLQPQPHWLGLPEGTLERDASFIRGRAYAPYNGARRGHDPERHCLRQGSVLRFQLTAPLQPEHTARLAQGLGLHREAGLGRVWAGGSLATRPAFAPRTAPVPIPAAAPVDDPLIHWLKARVDKRSEMAAGVMEAEKKQELLKKLYKNARRHNGMPDTEPVGPGPSQWSGVMARAKSAKSPDALYQELFRVGNGLCVEKSGNQGWGDETILDGRPLSFQQWFEEVCQGMNQETLCCFVAEFARRANTLAKGEHRA